MLRRTKRFQHPLPCSAKGIQIGNNYCRPLAELLPKNARREALRASANFKAARFLRGAQSFSQ